MQKRVERKLLDYGLHRGRISGIYRHPAATTVGTDGIGLHHIIGQQLIYEGPVPRDERHKLLIKGLGQTQGYNEHSHVKQRWKQY